ncbi:hypothetical protein OsI_32971 [Oryza sativa Indica Group]|uniref:Uncharacterized protein n=1 Tax=Oryza sativa subsp. indica TaxID=39946 RepID=A2Z5P6_ORYSI|nr:hypothetical protein OsI_32971 [Oryza sativa Indica Group]
MALLQPSAKFAPLTAETASHLLEIALENRTPKPYCVAVEVELAVVFAASVEGANGDDAIARPSDVNEAHRFPTVDTGGLGRGAIVDAIPNTTPPDLVSAKMSSRAPGRRP